MRRQFLTIILSIIAAMTLTAAPLREIRGAWIVTSPGIDWPRREADVERQKQNLITILDRLKDANFNTIYFQAQGEGDVLWQSLYQPAMADVTGNGNAPLRFDVAEFVVEAAHNRGLEVYAIIEPFNLGTYRDAMRYLDNPVKHPIESEPELIVKHNDKYYLDPGNPDSHEYLKSLYTELLTGYDFDGVLVDSPMYPAPDFNDSASYETFNYYDRDIDQWRVDNLNLFIRELYDLINEYNPAMRLQLATEGINHIDENGRVLTEPSYETLLEQEYIDMVVPKLFSRSDYGFTPALESWVESNISPRTVAGLTPETVAAGFHKPAPAVDEQIELTRNDENLGGVVIYRVSMITDTDDPSIAQVYTKLRNETFRYPAHLPLLYHSGDIPDAQLPPENVSATVDEYGNYIIEWDEAPADREGRLPKYYTVYVARDGITDITDPRQEIAHRVVGTSFIYPHDEPGLEFAVTAFDHFNNESVPAYTGRKDDATMNARDYIFRYYADNLYIAAPKTIKSIDIFNIWGNKVKHVETSGDEVSISCSDLGGGVYVVHTIYSDGAKDVNKFIK